MSIVESDGPPSWCLDASETGESIKYPWVGVVDHLPYPQALCTLSSFARIKRPRWRPVGLNDRHLRPHGKIGDCEQSSNDVMLSIVLLSIIYWRIDLQKNVSIAKKSYNG